MDNFKKQYRGRSGADQVRLSPNVLLGSSGLAGAKQCILEIISNALDERTPHVTVTQHEDGAVTIRDYAGGIPLGWSDDFDNGDGTKGAWGWDFFYNRLYASGKYDNSEVGQYLLSLSETELDNLDPDSIPYLFTVGVHGVGGTASQYASKYFEVKSYSGTECSRMRFEKGHPVLPSLEVTPSSEPQGTEVTLLPDDEVFTEARIPEQYLRSLCKSFSVIGGTPHTLITPTSTQDYPATSILDYFKGLYNDDTSQFSHNKTVYHEKETYLGKPRMSICEADVYVGGYVGDNQFYNNLVELHGGVHHEAVSSTVSRFFKRVIRGVSLQPQDYFASLTVLVSTRANYVDYQNQTKDSLNNPYVEKAIASNLSAQLDAAYANNEDWIIKVINEVTARARERTNRRATQREIKAVKEEIKKDDLPTNFRSCLNYELGRYDEVEIFLAEGESALGSLLLARDGTTQAMLPQRGKSLNVYKASVEDALRNSEINGLMKVLGCGMEVPGANTFNMSKLRCSKLILASDADIDGFHIRNLNFVILWKFFPELLYSGKVYIAETPRFSLPGPDGSMVYFRDDEELAEYKAKHPTSVKPQRYKGLGEVNPDVLSYTTLNPATRNLKKITIDRDDEQLLRALEVMYGADSSLRKELVLNMANADGYEGYKETLSRFVEQEKAAIKDLKDELETIVV